MSYLAGVRHFAPALVLRTMLFIHGAAPHTYCCDSQLQTNAQKLRIIRLIIDWHQITGVTRYTIGLTRRFCMSDFVAEYKETFSTALSAEPGVAVPLLTINCWILMQRKVTGGSVSFNQNWATYRDGFGSATGNDNYWLGLEKVQRLTRLGVVSLRVEVDRHASTIIALL